MHGVLIHRANVALIHAGVVFGFARRAPMLMRNLFMRGCLIGLRHGSLIDAGNALLVGEVLVDLTFKMIASVNAFAEANVLLTGELVSGSMLFVLSRFETARMGIATVTGANQPFMVRGTGVALAFTFLDFMARAFAYLIEPARRGGFATFSHVVSFPSLTRLTSAF